MPQIQETLENFYFEQKKSYFTVKLIKSIFKIFFAADRGVGGWGDGKPRILP